MTATDFKYLVSAHEPVIRSYAITLTKDPEDARDLTQDTLLRALLNSDKFVFGTNMKGWMYTIMRNVFINNYRRSKKFRNVGDTAENEQLVNSARGAAYSSAISQMRQKEIINALHELPASLRMPFELNYMGYPYKEVAELLGEPLGTVKSRIHSARKILSSKLDPQNN